MEQRAKLTSEREFTYTYLYINNKYKMAKTFKPGQIVPRLGQYEIIGPRGGKTGEEITGVKGKTLPLSPKHGSSYKLVDPTKH